MLYTEGLRLFVGVFGTKALLGFLVHIRVRGELALDFGLVDVCACSYVSAFL